MQAVGSQIFVIAIFPIVFIGFVLYTYSGVIVEWYRKLTNRDLDPPLAPAAPRRPQFGGDDCAICLQIKRLQVSATCGHSYCGMCLSQIYERRNSKIECPMCRRQITTLFRNFPRDIDHPDSQKAIEFIIEYNLRYNDERSWFRRLRQFPYVFRMVRRGIFNPRFVIFFIRSAFFFRFIFFFIFYLIMPLDLIPEKVFGVIGFLDDLFIAIMALTFMMSVAAVAFIRNRQ